MAKEVTNHWPCKSHAILAIKVRNSKTHSLFLPIPPQSQWHQSLQLQEKLILSEAGERK